MAEFAGSQTEKNLLKSFAGESQAKNRYTFFAKVAKKEGYEHIARLFMETAENEEQHAKEFFKFLEGRPVEITAVYPAGKIGTTEENLEASANGENEEYTELYPEFAKIAEEEGFKEIATKFKMVSKVEYHHEQRFLTMLKNLREGKTFQRDEKVRWKCEKCGHIHEGNKAPDKCPVCSHPQAYFEMDCVNY